MMIGNSLYFVRKLSEAQPLAFRVLRRIKVSCPLKKHGCQWEGDYGDLQSHLLSKTAHLNNSQGQENNVECSNRKNNMYGSRDNCDSDDASSTSSCHSPKPKHSKVLLDSKPINPSGKTDQQTTQSITTRMKLAHSFKDEANGKFSMRNYKESRELYKKGISVLNDGFNNGRSFDEEEMKLSAALHANVAATYMMTREYIKCIESCSIAIDLDRTYAKAYIRKSKALVALGKFGESSQIMHSLLEHKECISKEIITKVQSDYANVNHLNTLFSQGEQQLKQHEFASAKSTFGKILKQSNASNVIINAARADLGLGLTDSALRLSLQVLRSDPTCSDGYEVRGLTMHLMGDFESAIQLLKEGLRLNPDCSKIKSMVKVCRFVHDHVKKARSDAFTRKFDDAVQGFTTALDHQKQHLLPTKAPLYSKLLTERAECFLRLKQFSNTLSDASKAVYSLDDCIPAWIILTKALHGLGRHEEALSQLEDLMGKFGQNNELRSAYEKADFEVRKLKRTDLYSLFGVSSLASEMELKKAYKQKAKELHPDRLSGHNFTDDQRNEGERKFKMLGEGLEILCDDFKRQLYDEGYDPEAIRERVAAAQQAAHRQGGFGRQYHHNH